MRLSQGRKQPHLGSIGNELEQQARAGRTDMAAVKAIGIPVDRNVASTHGRQP